ncbi:MAG: hypothetical protein V4641_31460 [Pseudomonadota bacterium]
MSEQRNDYGFPLTSATDWLAVLGMAHPGAAMIGYRAKPLTKLERAQAIAAEVRARKFPPVKRITDPKE